MESISEQMHYLHLKLRNDITNGSNNSAMIFVTFHEFVLKLFKVVQTLFELTS